MRAHTKKHPIESKVSKHGNILADDYFNEVYGDRSRASVSLSGLRYREDYTQKELGDMIGVNQANISKMEKGTRPIGKDIAKRLAKVFKVDYRIFL
jgi:DNA-binding XRE family transcriptional regulator